MPPDATATPEPGAVRGKASPGGSSPATTAAERSARYAALAAAFRYPDAGAPDPGELGLPPRAADAGPAYLAAFDPAVSREACSLHEGVYATRDRNALFEELVRFYGFFGLEREEVAELPDHLTVELEFMHFLTFLEHHQAEQGRAVDDLRRAQRDFLERHLGVLARGVNERLHTDDRHLRELTRTLGRFVDDERAALADAAPGASARG